MLQLNSRDWHGSLKQTLCVKLPESDLVNDLVMGSDVKVIILWGVHLLDLSVFHI